MSSDKQSLSPAAWLQVGYAARAHGLRGELAVRPFDPDSTAVLEVQRLLLRTKDGEAREWAIRTARKAAKETLVLLEGISDRAGAERLVGAAVCVHRRDLPDLGEEEYFQGDLVGLEAFDQRGKPLGRVVELWETGPVPNLVIRGEGLPELLVPFAEPFVPEVDLEKRRLTVVPPEYEE